MRREKGLLMILMVFMISFLSYPVVFADWGPKPTALIEVVGIDEPRYFDLLVYYEDDVSVLDQDELMGQLTYYYRDDYPDILNGYQDEDGFASYTLYQNMPRTISKRDANVYFIGYFSPPDVFKIAIVTESNNLLVSETITKTLFQASFVYDFTNDTVVETEQDSTGVVFPDVGEVEEEIPFATITLMILVTVLLTLGLELGLLYLFGYREKASYYLVIFTNIFTQLLLYGFVFVVNYFWSGSLMAFLILILGEVFVLAIEMVLYAICMKEKQFIKPVVYAIIANIVSFGIGWIIASLSFSSII
ncbi:MAG: hypothetical protein JXL85_05885 [Bacilli bacterium]|nr:hypothetical protein [Bacilli bacterium]